MTAALAEQIAGTWRVRFAGQVGCAPKTVGPIADDATGRLESTTGIPTCHLEATLNGGEMDVIMTVIRNPGGPLRAGTTYEFKGTRVAR